MHMIWWYQHHGRLAWDGSNFVAYFCEALSVSQNGCINIHEGDRMQVVEANNIYQPFKPYPVGSVAYAAPGSSSTGIRIARNLPCAP
jgi:hypothetical protein